MNIHLNEQKLLNSNNGKLCNIFGDNTSGTGLPGSTNNILSAVGLSNASANGSNDANGSMVEGSTSITSTPFSFDSNGTTGSLQPGDQVSKMVTSTL